MALPLGTTRSLSPTFVSARDVSLAVKPPSAFTLHARFPTALRGPLGAPLHFGRRPPQSNCPPDTVPGPDKGPGLELRYFKGGIPVVAPRPLTRAFLRLPPMLYMKQQNPISGYSKAPWGLSVQSQVTCIFTGNSISPGPSSRQRSSRYTIRAGRNLPDKEFRYLRTVIVTAAVHRGFGSEPRAYALTPSLNLPALGRCQPLYFAFRLSRDLCFC